MGLTAVLPEENPLPGAEQEASLRKRDRLAGAGQRHLDVTRHIVGSLERVLEVRVIRGHESVQPRLKVATRARVGVLHDDENPLRVTSRATASVISCRPIPGLRRVRVAWWTGMGNFLRQFSSVTEKDPEKEKRFNLVRAKK
jgi:hypothetical protein